MTQALIASPAQRKRAANPPQAREQFLHESLRHERERRWRTEYADFIAAYNATLEQDGLPLEHWKTF
jgi:antitoxin CcdA